MAVPALPISVCPQAGVSAVWVLRIHFRIKLGDLAARPAMLVHVLSTRLVMVKYDWRPGHYPA